jgi:hypothetical protein
MAPGGTLPSKEVIADALKVKPPERTNRLAKGKMKS